VVTDQPPPTRMPGSTDLVPLLQIDLLSGVRVYVNGTRVDLDRAILSTLCALVLCQADQSGVGSRVSYRSLTLFLGAANVDDARRRMYRLRQWQGQYLSKRAAEVAASQGPVNIFPLAPGERSGNIVINGVLGNWRLFESDLWQANRSYRAAEAAPLNRDADLVELEQKWADLERRWHLSEAELADSPFVPLIDDLFFPPPRNRDSDASWRSAHQARADEICKVLGRLVSRRITGRQAWVDLQVSLGSVEKVRSAVDAWSVVQSPLRLPTAPIETMTQANFVALRKANESLAQTRSLLATRMKEQLTALLNRAAEVDSNRSAGSATTAPLHRRSRLSPRTQEFVAWLASRLAVDVAEIYEETLSATNQLVRVPASRRLAIDARRSAVSRLQLCTSLEEYYSRQSLDEASGVLYRARFGDLTIPTTILSTNAWQSIRVPLNSNAERFELVTDSPDSLGENGLDIPIEAAIARLAQIEISNVKYVNNPIYRLLDIVTSSGELRVTMGLDYFLAYVLSFDLLEQELVDAIVWNEATPGAKLDLPLRDRYLPSPRRAVDFRNRLCAGGPIALMAIARPGPPHRTGPSDYVLLIQERSSRVINVAGRIAVIPKAFHQPMVEVGAEVQLSSSLERELEEELLGRDELTGLATGGYVAPLHPQHLTEPMQWLADRRGTDAYRTECVGFGVNLVTGNYEFACLIVIDDYEWWMRYGGLLVPNWEVERVSLYSSRDPSSVTRLVSDPRWSNEGIFSLLEGLRRLSELDNGGRVSLPNIQILGDS